MASPAWFAVSAQVPADTVDTVLPETVHTSGVVDAKTNGLEEAPGVADTLKLPPGEYTGATGFDAKLRMVCVPVPTFMVKVCDPDEPNASVARKVKP